MPLAVRLASESASSESTGVSCGLPLFGGEDVDEVLGRCLEKSDELLERRLERREQHGAELVFARHRCELVLDA